MFFKKRKTKNEIIINSPFNGEIISLEEVPDPVFSKKMMGEGIAFIPETGEVFSPVSGEITQVFPTKHAVGFKTDEGVEVLLHLGLETVDLKGEGFNIKVSEGDKININDKIGDFNLSFIKEKGKQTISVLVFTNFAEQAKEQIILHSGSVQAGQEIVELRLK